MTRMTPLLALGLAGALCQPALAQDASSFLGVAGCRFAPVQPAPAQTPAWDGGCKDGFADGKGTLDWRDAAGKTYKLEATLAAGQVAGEGTLRFPDGTVYIGTLRGGVPDGKGYFSDPDGTQYEGDVRMGERTGTGEALYLNGDDYKGEFRKGKPDGQGLMTYALGGSYDGGWKDGEPNGPGRVVFAGGTGREAAVIDGRLPDLVEAATSDKRYVVRQDLPRSGSIIHDPAATNVSVPPGVSYDKLTPQEQATVKRWWSPALAPGDEPPYPVDGPALFLKTVQKIGSRLEQKGEMYVFIVVGKDGKVVSVKTVGLKDAEARKAIAIAAGILKYKPGICGGQPCEMVYPYHMMLTLD